MARHPTLYFSDGSLALKAADGTLYNVYRHNLSVLSEFFSGMLSLPIPNHPTISMGENARAWLEKAKIAGVNGTSDATAVELPALFTAFECEKFLEFVFHTQGWTLQMPPLEDLCAILKTSDFFVVPTGMAYAVHYLDKHKDLGSALRFRLGCDHHLPGWIAQAFDELIMGNPLTISPEDQELLGRDILLVLTQTHAKVTDHRVTLAICPPEPIHATWCYNLCHCTTEWEKAWTSVHGVLGMLLKDEFSGAEIHDNLENLVTGSMTGECRVLTCTNLKEAPGQKSVLKKRRKLLMKQLQFC
ncbi:hypothetical protein B0H14DRAFT_3531832 [Mycena olivaceomarginata]|nr:hypothetical protein B0H14DRAFT_3531832 [Mycena olivaceomarginata]